MKQDCLGLSDCWDTEMMYNISQHIGYQPNTLYNLDARDAMSHVPPNHFDFILTSPPYLGQRSETSNIIKYMGNISSIYGYAVNRLSRTGCFATVVRSKRTENNWFDMRLFSTWESIYRSLGLNMLNVLIWAKTNPVPAGDLINKPLDIPSHEYIFVGTKANSPREANSRAGKREYATKTIVKSKSGNMRGDSSYTNGHSNLNEFAMGFDVIEAPDVIKAPTADGKDRPVAKGGSFSVKLAKELIYRFSEEGQLVADIFAGVCTTGKACELMGRRFWGCDKDLEDLQKGCDWLNNYGQGRLL